MLQLFFQLLNQRVSSPTPPTKAFKLVLLRKRSRPRFRYQTTEVDVWLATIKSSDMQTTDVGWEHFLSPSSNRRDQRIEGGIGWDILDPLGFPVTLVGHQLPLPIRTNWNVKVVPRKTLGDAPHEGVDQRFKVVAGLVLVIANRWIN